VIHRAAARKSTTNWVKQTKAASSLILLVSTARREETRETGVAVISIKGRKALNDERRPVPSLKFALADTNELHCCDRVCLRDHKTLFPFTPLNARAIMVMHTMVLCR